MTFVYVVCLVDLQGDLTPLVAFSDEETAKLMSDRMGDAGTYIEVPLVDGDR